MYRFNGIIHYQYNMALNRKKVIHINKHTLNGLIKDVQLQLQKNTERLNHHLSKNERAQILGENEAIENTIAKLQEDLAGAEDVEADNQKQQQSFTKPLGQVQKEKREEEAKQFAKELGLKSDTNSQKEERTFAEVLGVNKI